MRTAVMRIDVDPAGELAAEALAQGVEALRRWAAAVQAEVVAGALPDGVTGRCEVQLLALTADANSTVAEAIRACKAVFGTEPSVGVVTFVSRGTDDDAHGVLAGFGLSGVITRRLDAQGFDVVEVVLCAADLDRVPESRIHTALEASLNCEVQIHRR